MAVTRRQFVAGMSALAASLGFNSAQVAKITEALAFGPPFDAKPKVLWVHGAECTGCTVSLLSLYEDARGKAIRGTNVSTLDALQIVAGTQGKDVLTQVRTLQNSGFNVDPSPYAINVQDILVDWIDLQYHETVQSMGGDLAYRFLADNMVNGEGAEPFVLVVEGAVQDKHLKGAWGDDGETPWCSIGMPDGDPIGGFEDLSFDDVVQMLAEQSNCLGVIAIGQCATFGGIPAAVSPDFVDFLGNPINPLTGEVDGTSDNKGRQTGAMGTYEFLVHKESAAADKVVNVPGCPTNPWWFVLSVVCFLIGKLAPDAVPGILDLDATRRLKAVYGTPLHGPACARYGDYVKGIFAENPGDSGCLQLIGCKGPSVNSLCGVHGWNGQQPENIQSTASVDSYGVASIRGKQGGNCIMAGHPCMGCTEKGYPDAFVPFVLR